MKKTLIYPLAVIPAIPTENKIKFMPCGSQSWVVSNHVDVVWAILEECRGYYDIKKVVSRVKKKLPETSQDVIESVIEHLLNLGVLLDRREAFRSIFPMLSNPSVFPMPMTPAEIREYTATPRLPVKRGTTYKLSTFDSDDVLAQLQASRRSCRSFSTSRTLSLLELGRVLIHAYSLPLHSTPSGGALYPLKLYVIVTRDQEELPKGYYEYDPEKHEIIGYDTLDRELMQHAFWSETLLHNAPVIIVIAVDLKRQSMKYGNRAYLLGAIETGLAAENIHLAANQEGLATLQYGGFAEKLLAAEMRMNEGIEEGQVWPFSTIAIGHESNDTLPDDDAQLEELSEKLVGRGKPVKGLYIVRNNGERGTNNIFGVHADGRFPDAPDHKFVAAGTAASVALAKIKALGEAYERHASGLVRIERVATAKELTEAHEQWLDPRIVAPFTDEQYRQLKRYQPFQENKPWEWVEGRLAATDKPIWVPVDLAFYPINAKSLGRKLCFGATSSGVAAYSNEPEAIRRALFELLERHATMDSWFRHDSLRPIDPALLPYHWQRRVAYWKTRGREVYVLDMSDRVHGIVAVNVTMIGDTFPYFMCGAAASDNFETALAKAFNETELMIVCARESKRKKYLEPEDVNDVLDHALLYAQSPKHAAKLEWLWSGKVKKEIPNTTKSVEQVLKDLDAVIVRLSPPGAPLYVFRVLSEHLIPLDFGYGTNHYTHKSLGGNINSENKHMPHYFA